MILIYIHTYIHIWYTLYSDLTGTACCWHRRVATCATAGAENRPWLVLLPGNHQMVQYGIVWEFFPNVCWRQFSFLAPLSLIGYGHGCPFCITKNSDNSQSANRCQRLPTWSTGSIWRSSSRWRPSSAPPSSTSRRAPPSTSPASSRRGPSTSTPLTCSGTTTGRSSRTTGSAGARWWSARSGSRRRPAWSSRTRRRRTADSTSATPPPPTPSTSMCTSSREVRIKFCIVCVVTTIILVLIYSSRWPKRCSEKVEQWSTFINDQPDHAERLDQLDLHHLERGQGCTSPSPPSTSEGPVIFPFCLQMLVFSIKHLLFYTINAFIFILETNSHLH